MVGLGYRRSTARRSTSAQFVLSETNKCFQDSHIIVVRVEPMQRAHVSRFDLQSSGRYLPVSTCRLGGGMRERRRPEPPPPPPSPSPPPPPTQLIRLLKYIHALTYACSCIELLLIRQATYRGNGPCTALNPLLLRVLLLLPPPPTPSLNTSARFGRPP